MRLRGFASALLLLAAALLLCARLAPAAENPELQEVLKQANQRLARKEYEAAAAEFKRAGDLAGGPCGPCLLGLASAYTGTGDLEKAAKAARKAIPLTSEGTEARTVLAHLAEVLMRSGRHAEALEIARLALGTGPEGGTNSVSARFVLCQARKAMDSPFAGPLSPSEARCGSQEDLRRGTRLASGASVPAGKEVTRPERLFGNPPGAPPGLRGSQHGESVVSAVIDEEGCVRDIRVCSGKYEEFNQATREAVSGWVFKPATLDGAPVAVYYTLSTYFQIAG